jgi:crotonobetainyl-CoA:carnitine CoA-transferase CaiB-like acyl-CoA transferase
VIARGVVVDIEHPTRGKVSTAANPMRLSASPVTYRSAPPLVGEHTDVVLGEWLGLNAGQITALRDKKVI